MLEKRNVLWRVERIQFVRLRRGRAKDIHCDAPQAFPPLLAAGFCSNPPSAAAVRGRRRLIKAWVTLQQSQARGQRVSQSDSNRSHQVVWTVIEGRDAVVHEIQDAPGSLWPAALLSAPLHYRSIDRINQNTTYCKGIPRVSFT